MLRFVNICLVLGLVALAYVIYQVKYEARALDEEIASLGKEIDTERDGLAVLRAEWSLLNRPERIERLAQKFLKLAPVQPRQFVTVDSVSDRDFTRTARRGRDDHAGPIGDDGAGRQGRCQGPDHGWGGHAAGDAGTAAAHGPPRKVIIPLQAAAQ